MTLRVFATIVCAGFLAGSAAMAAEPSVERGDYIVNSIGACGSCHTPFGPNGPDMSKALGGRVVEDSEAFTAIAPNITPGGEIAGWSDEELGRAIREGVRPDGSIIGPPMPFEVYHGISDTDLASIVMYLRSIPAVENDPGKSEYRIPLPPAWGPPVTSVADVPAGVSVEYGAYLAGPLGHCTVCHTPFGPNGAPQFEMLLGAGGNEFHGPWGTSVSANITPTELAQFSDAEVETMIRKGMRPGDVAMFPPMSYPHYDRVSADDMAALILYLRSLEPKPFQ